MANLLQYNLALEERLDKHGSQLYKLENLNIPYQVRKEVDEIVTDAVDWTMQAPLRALFSDFPAVDMKEILQQRMFKDKSYEAHEDHKKLYDALEKSLERDYSDQLLSDLEEARQKKRKRRDVPRTPSWSSSPQPAPLPPLVGAFSAPGSKSPSSFKSAAFAPQSMAWTTSAIRYELAGVSGTQELSPMNSQIQDDSIPVEHVYSSDDEDSGNNHLPKAVLRKDWWKPLPKEERPATPKPAWTIPSSIVSDVKNNRATTLVSAYETPIEHSLLTKTGDMTNFLNCGSPGHVTIQTQFFFNKVLEYLRYGSKGSSPALSISKMKPTSYPDIGLELLKFYIDRHASSSCKKEVRSTMRILSVVRIKAYSRYDDFKDLNLLLLQGHLDHLLGSDKRMLSTAVKLWTSNLVIRQQVKDLQLGIECYQTQLNLTKPGWHAIGYEFKHDYTIIESP
uniref:Uncharacterized protein n=1 Tax=Tanacetum cinerariifolium TaxID=118510 RepID=A0A6L2LL10_TANCI|nr:hypothetical protein [Tanacetum cinerariifolium]